MKTDNPTQVKFHLNMCQRRAIKSGFHCLLGIVSEPLRKRHRPSLIWIFFCGRWSLQVLQMLQSWLRRCALRCGLDNFEISGNSWGLSSGYPAPPINSLVLKCLALNCLIDKCRKDVNTDSKMLIQITKKTEGVPLLLILPVSHALDSSVRRWLHVGVSKTAWKIHLQWLASAGHL